MSLFKKASLSAAFATPCLFAGLTTLAQAAQVPDYFLKEYTVSKNCTEQHAGLAARVDTGLKFRVAPDASGDGSYVFQAEDNGASKWAANWNNLRLEYRPGTQITTVPADFECVPSQQATSSFLAMSGFSQASEPYYEQEHFYGLAKIHGQLEHVLIFPRNATTGPKAIVVLLSVNSPGNVKLDDNGVIHSE
jgi:hypothetical protein